MASSTSLDGLIEPFEHLAFDRSAYAELPAKVPDDGEGCTEHGGHFRSLPAVEEGQDAPSEQLGAIDVVERDIRIANQSDGIPQPVRRRGSCA